MGKRADLILVDGSPLANISDLRKVSWVVANGLLYDKGSSGGVSGSTHNFGGRGVRIRQFHRHGSRACSAREIRKQALLANRITGFPKASGRDNIPVAVELEDAGVFGIVVGAANSDIKKTIGIGVNTKDASCRLSVLCTGPLTLCQLGRIVEAASFRGRRRGSPPHRECGRSANTCPSGAPADRFLETPKPAATRL